MLLHSINPLTIKEVMGFLSNIEKPLLSKKLSNSQNLDKFSIKKLEKHWQCYLTIPFKISSIHEMEEELEVIINEAKSIYRKLDVKLKQQLLRHLNINTNRD